MTTTDFHLPRRSVDEDATLDDRLTDNAQDNIGPERYFERDEEGKLIEESWDEVFARVAQNLAVAEAVHHDDIHRVPMSVLADWVDPDTAYDLFNVEPRESIVDYEPMNGGLVIDGEPYAELTEELAPYISYDALTEYLREHYDDELSVVEDLESVAEDFEELMRTQQFMPNSPTLMNAGTEVQQLSACFVDSPQDSIEDICDTEKEWTLVQKSGGGMGGAFHLLRPKGHPISTTGGVSSGPISFMTKFDHVAGVIKQGGKRRGAQMGIMHCQHPDIGRFCLAKRGEDSFTNFNISVGVSDEFFEAVQNNESFPLRFPVEADEVYEVTPELAHFYSPEFEDAWNEDYDKPAEGYDGKVVEENFWRDYQDEMQDPEAFEQYRDQMYIEPGDEARIPAGFVWQLLVDGAHNNGEPGFYSYDESNREHSFDTEQYPEHAMEATNPCAEQMLEEYEACNLGHINLSLVVDEDALTYDEWLQEDLPGFDEYHHDELVPRYLDEALDTEHLERVARLGTRFLDNVVTMSRFPLDEISESVRDKRKIGLGLMGYHHLLLQLGVEYGSKESYAIAEDVMRRIDSYGTEMSHDLAGDRGVFAEYDESKWSDPTAYEGWFEKHAHQDPYDHEDGYAMRNHNITTIAPTGTTSMIADTSGGCEPIYNVAFLKNVSDDVQGEEMLVEFDSYFLDILEANDVDVDAVKEEAKELMLANEFEGPESLSAVPEDIAEIFVTTADLSVEQHILTQAAFQRFVDSGISKTLNIRNEAGMDEVGDAFEMAIEHGIKGATVYRDGSRMEQVKTTRATDNKLDDEGLEAIETEELVEELESRVDAPDMSTDVDGGKALVELEADD